MDDLYLNNKIYCDKCSGRHSGKWHCCIIELNCSTICKCPIKRFDNDKDYFPVLLPFTSKEYGRTRYYVPFAMIKEHEAQCLENHGQTPERLKERGGLSWDEMWAVVHDIHWSKAEYQTAEDARVPMIKFAETWKPSGFVEDTEREFLVPVEWSMCGFVKVKAPNAKAAMEIVQSDNDDISIPNADTEEYIDGSFKVSGYDDPEDCIGMIEAYTQDYENGKPFPTLN